MAPPRKEQVILKDDTRQPWDRQPWDSDKSFHAFQTCYLTQSPPRTIIRAFELWMKETGKSVRRNRNGTINMHPHFYNWVHGRNTAGEKPLGSVYESAQSWIERADAFDVDSYRKLQQAFRRQQGELRQKEFEAGDTLLERALLMMQQRPSPDEFTESEIGKHVELAFKLMRRALEMEDKVVAVKEWRGLLEDAGLDPEDILEQTINRIAEQIESSDSE